MNRLETTVVNSPPRRWLQRYYELPWMLRLAGEVRPGARALELGCGTGYGTELLPGPLPPRRRRVPPLTSSYVSVIRKSAM